MLCIEHVHQSTLKTQLSSERLISVELVDLPGKVIDEWRIQFRVNTSDVTYKAVSQKSFVQKIYTKPIFGFSCYQNFSFPQW